MSTYKHRKRFSAKMAKALIVILCVQTFFPVSLFALTSGPTQPEFSEFEPVGTTQMVDLFSGDFVYNIPLFELPGPDGGYPFNLSYHSGVTMDQEATWVGLGWTMNHGAINRTMRGFPDDFNGEDIESKTHLEPNRTWRFGLSGHTEFLGFDLGKDIPGKIGAALGLKASINNYRGVGLSTSFGLSTKFIENDDKGSFVKTKGEANLDLSFGSEDGANLSGSLSIGSKESKNRASLSFGKSGREGMQSLSLGYTRKVTSKVKGQNKNSTGTKTTPVTANYTYTKSNYTPQVSLPYRGMHFTGSVELGSYPGFLFGVGPEIDVSFNRQTLKHNNQWTKAPAYGYFHLRTDVEKGLSDFNREKDGRIYEKTPNLANPITTPDIYSVTGQGTGGMYRAYRSDVGTLSDPKVTSRTGGGTLGIDINALAGIDGGADIGGNFSISSNRRWNGPNEFRFNPENVPDEYEPFYFKAAGEMTAEELGTYDYVGGEQALSLGLNPFPGEFQAPNWNMNGNGMILGTNSTNSSALGTSLGRRDNRKPRSNSIQYITNGQLLGPNGEESLNEYEIEYYTLDNSGNINFAQPESLERADDKPDQFAGMTALQPNGMRYVYGLPVMNKEHHEVSFSAPANENGPVECDQMDLTTDNYSINAAGDEVITPTDFAASGNYLNHTKMPEYAHSYLLTSVLGADYVDMGTPGPSDEDYGYWVKFNYVKTTTDENPYIWKTPFDGANFIPGSFADRADDKGMIVAGKREQYYLASAETRTHYAEFEIETREDGRGADELFQKDDAKGAYSHKLKSIKLFSKLERETSPTATPIKTVVFKYAGDDPFINEPELCNGIDNGSGGKLTLKSVHFEYENSTRGSLSPYQFVYGENPSYDPFSFDRWGTYKGGMDECQKFNEPYSEQDKTIADENVGAWSLSEVFLPSGATIKVDYESDDYAYVQDEVAMQMFKLGGDGTIVTSKDPDPTEGDLTITFMIESGEDDIRKYMDGLHGVTENNDGTLNYDNAQLYFKIKSDLNGSDSKDYVKGYARIEDASINGLVGSIELKPVDLNGTNYHPFAAAAWQHLKATYPQGAMDGVDLDNADENNFRDALQDLGAAFGQIKAVFSNFYKYCSSENFGDSIIPDESFIRLCSPDRVKMGGGSRVKQITLDDNWDIGEDDNDDDPTTYGQYFEYTDDVRDENGDIIETMSSGVAMNEPAIGYDECALRYAKIWNNRSSLLASDDNIIFEYPINESYYPGASVGYSKVTVKSLATHYAMNDESAPAGLPVGFGTTGVTVNEFYTAKDFPVITKETVLRRLLGYPKQLLFGLVNLTSDMYTGSQGYTITLNDMHGKPHKVTHYGLNDQNKIIDQKLSEVVYTYSEGEPEINTTGERRKIVRTLNNVVPVLKAPYNKTNPDADVEDQVLGVNYETFMDMRESWSTGAEGSVGLNAKYTPPFIFGFAAWPRMNINYSSTRTAVVNKIIRKSGILIKTDAYDGQSHITTSNEVFDPLTGEPLLTSVNNSFDDEIYNYNIPARFSYDRMGPAYENWGMQFSGILSVDPGCGYFKLSNISNDVSFLIRGDECIMTDFANNGNCIDNEELCNNRKFTYVGFINGSHLFENNNLTALDGYVGIEMMILRSGNRNHLSAKSGNIAALSNPLENRSPNPITSVSYAIPNPGNGIAAVTASQITVDNILNASAVTYSDAWDLERNVDSIQSVVVTASSGEETENCLNVEVPAGSVSESCENPSRTVLQYDVGGVSHTRTFYHTGEHQYISYCYSNNITITSYEEIQGDEGCFEPPVVIYDITVEDSGNPTSEVVEMAISQYNIGQLGIWRPQKSYTYVEERTPQNLVANNGDLIIRTDGVFDDLVLFDWRNPFFPQLPLASNWKQTNEITKYSRNGEEVENRDIIGLYSSAMYGYKDNLPVAVAANAAFHEIGFESFEESPLGAIIHSNKNQGFDFGCNDFQKQMNLTYNVLGAYVDGDTIWIDKEHYEGMPIPDNAFLLLQDKNGKEYEAAAGVTGISALDPESENLQTYFRGDVCALGLTDIEFCEVPENTPLTGRVVLQYKNTYPSQYTCYSFITDEEAHSGKNSLKVTNSSIYDQQSLQLTKDRKYVISAWVKNSFAQYGATGHTYDPDVNITMNMSGATPLTFYPAGEIIEGWQRIEGVFTAQGGGFFVGINVPQIQVGVPTYYFDDLRIYPEDGSIQTYVYNREDYRLQAVLDQNNYATFYKYDEEGNLFLIKKETARGIKTIQETREYVKVTSSE